MTEKALLIGINYIGTESELKGCINDVLNMKKYVLKVGYTIENIKVMTEASESPDCIPTASNIINALGWLRQGATSESELFLHYSGHGGSIIDTNCDETDGRDETICPLDYASRGDINDDIIRKYLVDYLPKGCRLTAIFDCCHSGTIMDLKYNWTGHPKNHGAYRLIVDRTPMTKASIIALSGCQDKQYSADTFEVGQAQGAMTYAFLSVIEQNDKKRNLTCKELIRDMDKLLKDKGYDQVPQLSCGRMVELSDVFSIKHRAPLNRSVNKPRKNSKSKKRVYLYTVSDEESDESDK